MDIHVSANDENVVFRDAMNNSGELIVEGDKFSFFTNIGRAVTGDNYCNEFVTKCSYHHHWVYFSLCYLVTLGLVVL